MASQDPPSYEQAIGSARLSQRERNGISAQRRRSIEDESRPLPDGWVRTFDPENHHQFFVDIRAEPPRSIWHHPYDDEQYLNSLPLQDRELLGGLTRHPSIEDVAAETTDEEDEYTHHPSSKAAAAGTATAPHEGSSSSSSHPPHQQQAEGSSSSSSPTASKPRSFGRKMKDKLTGTTHEERNAERARRQQREQDLYRQHELFRRGLAAAIQTGRPQRLGQDDDAVDVYLEPPDARFPGVTSVRQLSPSLEEVFYAADAPGVPKGARHVRPVSYSSYRGGGMMGGGDAYPGGMGGMGRSPYGRPFGPYNRPMGMGYGGGMGMMPMALPLFGGMALGGMLF
ncbi:hypothetical protein PG994_002946 [Apiospora phragmitis]|uniref:WW domain-containing protein n=1 Tax=Apiospora phragmitis TaxID=2905665 RepID=A0ABR1W6N3_9PEZI